MSEERSGSSIVTLVGVPFAKVDQEFIFLGGTRKCEDCRLRSTCLNLEEGRRYKVESVREGIKHECPLHEDGVCVVEVVEAEIEAALEARKAVEGSKIVFEMPSCDEWTCDFYDLCHPAGLASGDKCTILSIFDIGKTCPMRGNFLKKVLLKRNSSGRRITN